MINHVPNLPARRTRETKSSDENFPAVTRIIGTFALPAIIASLVPKGGQKSGCDSFQLHDFTMHSSYSPG